MLEIDFRDGFRGETVVVRAARRVLWRGERLMTNLSSDVPRSRTSTRAVPAGPDPRWRAVPDRGGRAAGARVAAKRVPPAQRLVAVVGAVAIVSGCGGGGPVPQPLSGAHVVKLLRAPPGAEYDTPVWVPVLHALVVKFSPRGRTDDAAYNSLYALHLDGRRERLDLPKRAGCRLTSSDVPTLLPDGSVGYLQTCWGSNDPAHAVRLMRWDPRTRRTARLRAYDLKFSMTFFSVARGGRAIINDGNSLQEKLWWLGASGPNPTPEGFGRAGYPSWSPDGRRLAVDAVPKGHFGLEAARNLYLLDRGGHVAATLVRDAHDVGPAAWSPDGRRLALAMRPPDGDFGLYLVDVRTRVVRLVVERERLGGVTWTSPCTLAAAVGVFSHLTGTGVPAGILLVRLIRIGPV